MAIRWRLLCAIVLTPLLLLSQNTPPVRIAGHDARFGDEGQLLPWIGWNDALEREMHFYQQCPVDHGYPRFVSTTFLNGDWSVQTEHADTIPAMQNGMGILSYLKYYELPGKRDGAYLKTARAMGDYLIDEALTPDEGKYPRFVRSTGTRGEFPQPADCGSQSDHAYEIKPDKGGIAGYALLQLYKETGEQKYLKTAEHHAHVLVANQRAGDATHSPWPFRVDYRSGDARGDVSGDMTYILRLYDGLVAEGDKEFEQPRAALWLCIKTYQIPSAGGDGALFAQFFEDQERPTNRTAWAPLNLARYLLGNGRDWIRSGKAIRGYSSSLCGGISPTGNSGLLFATSRTRTTTLGAE
jgi:hypothetical protein